LQSGEKGKNETKSIFFSLLQATPAKGLLAFDPKSDLFVTDLHARTY